MRVQGTPSFANARNENRFRPGAATVDRLRKLAGGLLLCGIALVSATANAQTTLNASPTSVLVGGTVTATWSGIPAPSGSNWLGLYTPGAASNGFNLYGSRYTNGAASGSVPFTLPAAATPGTYELRLFASGYTLLATSNSFTVVAPPTVSGTVTLGSSALSGVTFAATNGVTCPASNTSGQYSCTVPLGWSGSVTPSRGGVSFTPASRDYSNVTANQTAQNYPGTSTTTLSASPTSVYVNGTVTATWSGTPGPSGSNWLGLYVPGAASNNFNLYGSGSTNGQASGSAPFTLPAAATPGTYELRLFANGYTLLATSNSFTVNPLPTVSGTVTLNGSPLSGVTIEATNGVTCPATNTSGQYSCTVPPGWSGSVTPSRGGVSFTPASRDYSNVTVNQTAQNYPGTSTTTLSASPTSVAVSGTVTATWSGTPGPSGSNWLGLYTPGAASNGSNLYSYRYTDGTASGSVPFTLPAAATPGTYELRLFSNGTYALLATSNSFSVVPPRSVSGTVTVGGSPLAGVAFAATNGGTCTASNASGQYSCTVLQGWSGSITPSLTGYTFTPATRNYSNVVANQTGQNFVGATVSAQAAYYIFPDHLNTPRLIANQQGTTVWRWDQGEPFGNDVPNNNPSGAGAFDFPLRFPGQYFDRETNLAYNWMRDYDPGIGRYVQSDPLGVIGLLKERGILFGYGRDRVENDPKSPVVEPDDPMIQISLFDSPLGPIYNNDFSFISLYAYANDNPLSRIDFDGMAPGGAGFAKCVRDCNAWRNFLITFICPKCPGYWRAVCVASALAGHAICIANCTSKYFPKK